MDNITKLRYWTYKILPLVYDDSLSYYEVLSKVQKKINELVDSNNEMPEAITNEITKQLNGDYATNIDDRVQSLITSICKGIATDEGKATFTENPKQGGELIWLNGTLYKVTAVMTAGQNYIVGTNIDEVKISEEIHKIKNEYLEIENEHWNERASRPHAVDTFMFWKDELYRVTNDIKINDILYDGGDNQNITKTYFGVEVYNHYVEMHEADNNLQTQIDGNDGDIENLQNGLTTETNRATTRENNIDNRISNIVAQSGNDNTEITDARKWASKLGERTSVTIGDAIRDQIELALTGVPQVITDNEITGNYTSLDTFPSNTIVALNSTKPSNIAPNFKGGIILTLSFTTKISERVQISIDVDNNWYSRFRSGGTAGWGDWEKLDNDDVISSINNLSKRLQNITDGHNFMQTVNLFYNTESAGTFADLNNLENNRIYGYSGVTTTNAPTTDFGGIVVTLSMGTSPTSNTTEVAFAYPTYDVYVRSEFGHTGTWSKWAKLTNDPVVLNTKEYKLSDYGNLYECFKAISADNGSYTKVLNIPEGDYDMYQLYGGDDYFNSIDKNNLPTTSTVNPFMDNIKIIGNGKCYIHMDFPKSIPDSVRFLFAPINIRGNAEITGIHVECTRGRYAMHYESGQLYPNTNALFKNVYATLNGTTRVAMGCGVSNGQNITLEDCVLNAPMNEGVFSCHYKYGSSFNFKNCIFNGLTTKEVGAIRLSSEGQRYSEVHIDNCMLTNETLQVSDELQDDTNTYSDMNGFIINSNINTINNKYPVTDKVTANITKYNTITGESTTLLESTE